MLIKKNSPNIIEEIQVQEILNRVIISEYEWGLQKKNGSISYVPSNKISWIIKWPWNDYEIYIIDKRNFPINFKISPYLSKYKLEVVGTVNVNISNPKNLVLNIQNPTDTVIIERIKSALEMALNSIISTLNLSQIQRGEIEIGNNRESDILYEIGISPQYLTINNISLPHEIEVAFHNVTASEFSKSSINNIAQSFSNINPVMAQQVLQWENRGSISDLLGILLFANLANRESFSNSRPTIELENSPQINEEIEWL